MAIIYETRHLTYNFLYNTYVAIEVSIRSDSSYVRCLMDNPSGWFPGMIVTNIDRNIYSTSLYNLKSM